MVHQKTLVERAFELAGSGACATVKDICRRLKRESFTVGEIDDHLRGKVLRQQLTQVIQRRA